MKVYFCIKIVNFKDIKSFIIIFFQKKGTKVYQLTFKAVNFKISIFSYKQTDLVL